MQELQYIYSGIQRKFIQLSSPFDFMHLHPNIRNHLEFISHFSKKEVFVSNLRKRQKRPKKYALPSETQSSEARRL